MPDEKTMAELVQNLRDAGCCEELIRRYLEAGDQDRKALLARHRAELMDDVHRCQKKVDCLDYLIYQRQKQK